MRGFKFKKWGKRVMGIVISLLIIFALTISITISIINSYKKYIYNLEDIPSGNDAIIVLNKTLKYTHSSKQILSQTQLLRLNIILIHR